MDDAVLTQKVEDAVAETLQAREAFTMVDISHPIITEDPSVRHREVRAKVEAIISRGDLDEAEFTASPITVYPLPSKPVTARLFHPDEPGFDPSSYTATMQELRRDAPAKVGDQTPQLAQTRGYNMTDSDGSDGSDDNVTVVTSTVSGAKVTKQCFVQPQAGRLNIPKVIVRAAGYQVGDKINVTTTPNSVRIEKSPDGAQEVDSAGRIRLGKGKLLDEQKPGHQCNALVVDPADGEKYIEVQ